MTATIVKWRLLNPPPVIFIWWRGSITCGAQHQGFLTGNSYFCANFLHCRYVVDQNFLNANSITWSIPRSNYCDQMPLSVQPHNDIGWLHCKLCVDSPEKQNSDVMLLLHLEKQKTKITATMPSDLWSPCFWNLLPESDQKSVRQDSKMIKRWSYTCFTWCLSML